MKLEIFEPAMCCSTGVCGPDVDEKLVDFANDVKWLKSNGIDVDRFNLGQEPEVFTNNEYVLGRIQNEGSAILPLMFIDGQLVTEGGYPNRKLLGEITGITKPMVYSLGAVSSDDCCTPGGGCC